MTGPAAAVRWHIVQTRGLAVLKALSPKLGLRQQLLLLLVRLLV